MQWSQGLQGGPFLEVSFLLELKEEKKKTAQSIINKLSNFKGLRDLTLMSVLYDTGARVKELIDIKISKIIPKKPACFPSSPTLITLQTTSVIWTFNSFAQSPFSRATRGILALVRGLPLDPLHDFSRTSHCI